MKGNRIYGSPEKGLAMMKGDYGRLASGEWMCVTPNGHMGNLTAHEVTEHKDGTITVSPSILVTSRENGKDVEIYHGWLKEGVWTP